MWLPRIETPKDYEQMNLRDPEHAGAVAEICARHGVPATGLRQFPRGSSIVYAVGEDIVVKLYPPVFADECEVETSVLRFIDGSLAVPTPRVLGQGELEGWRYCIMTRMHGDELRSRWESFPADTRVDLGRQLGLSVRELHRLPVAEVPLRDEWPEFLKQQIEGCSARQQRLGLEARWVDQIPSYLASVGPELSMSTERALLHTEVMADHLLVDRDSEESAESLRDRGTAPPRWTLSGLIDFEPAMIGAAEYDFAAVGLFVAGGDAAVMTGFLDGYEYPAAERAQALPRRIMAYTLLHRYSKLTWYLKFMPPAQDTDDLESLARRWFGGIG